MRSVIVPVGPRASGKSTFCEKAISLDPSITWISRDKLLVEIFGKTSLDPYSGGHYHVLEVMWSMVGEHMESSPNSCMILDMWNGTSDERVNITSRLRRFDVDRIEAWYFVTPVEFVNKWFWNKPDVAKIGEMKDRQAEGLTFFLEDSPRRDHELFHKLAQRIELDGFDEVIRVNPLLTRPEHILPLQTSLEF